MPRDVPSERRSWLLQRRDVLSQRQIGLLFATVCAPTLLVAAAFLWWGYWHMLAYAALELGESLTSMYMRINDMVFDPDTERELEEVDVVDDPLIRCLFSDTFGAYQAAQLRRLLARPIRSLSK